MKQLDTNGRWLRFGLAQLVLAPLVACGGGSPDNQTEATPQATRVTAYDSLAEPAGDLCAKRETSTDFGVAYCVEPTSSSTTVAALWAELQKPAGNFIKLSAAGVNVNQPPGAVGQQYLGLGSRTFFAGQGAIHQGGETYNLVTSAPSPSANDLIFAGSTQTMLKISGVDPAESGSVLEAYWTRIIGDVSAPGSTELDTWHSYFGLRADWVDAPVNPDVVFSGSMLVSVGDNAYQEDIRTQRSSYARCPVTLLMNLVSGEIKSKQALVECVDSDTGAAYVVDINGAKLISKASRIQAGKSGSMSYADSSKGIVFDGEPLTQVTGGVYGRGVAELVIHGVNSQGYMLVRANRVD